MPLFNRASKTQDSQDSSATRDQDSETKKEKPGWKRPANTAFKQQRLKAWQPILTPKTVLPTLFLIGIIFGPIGGLLIWGSSLVSEMTFDYTGCQNLQKSSSISQLNFVNMPNYSYRMRSKDTKFTPSPPQYAFLNEPSNDVSSQNQCIIKFDVPADLDPSVFLYYKLTNFYQNHRRYVKSLDSDQLIGKVVSKDTLNKGDCKPLALDSNGKIIYPCGLVANSVFNDTFSNLTLLNQSNESNGSIYNFFETGIAWPGEAKKYATVTQYNVSDIVPPPNWVLRYPSWNTSNLPNLHEDEHFQNWMRTAGLPTFSKLYGRNDQSVLVAGEYQIIVNMNFPVLPYKGTKSIVISTVSWIGGKNPFLGWAYVATSAVFVLLAIAGTVRHALKPRRLGDMSLLSWNR